jgi:hypothetical protein
VRQPSAAVVPTSLPFEASNRPSGTVTWNSSRPTRFDGWSRHGQNKSQPSDCTALAIHGLPSAVFDQTKPPSHGALGATRGLPAYEMPTCAAEPLASGAGSSMLTKPSLLDHIPAASG